MPPRSDHRRTVAQHLWDQTNDAEAVALDAVTSCRPTTLAGIVALAGYVEAYERRSRGPFVEDDRCWQTLSAIAGALAAGAAPAATVAAASAPEAGDRRLQAIFARWQAKQREIAVLPGDYSDEDINRLCEELAGTEREMHDCPARTWGGVVMKAEVAKSYREFHDCAMGLAGDAHEALFDAIAALASRRA